MRGACVSGAAGQEVMLTKTIENACYSKLFRLNGREPFVQWPLPYVTVQLQSGRSTHILSMLEPTSLSHLAVGDEIEIVIFKRRKVRTRLGKLVDKICGRG